MENDHILELTADYALGLLPPEERRRVEAHTGRCPACRAALQRERSIEALVRGVVHQTARPAPARLAAVRAATIARSAPRPRAVPLHRRLAPVTLVTVLLALGLLFGRGRSPFAPAVFAGGTPTQTATSTHTPTATLAAIDPAGTETSPSVARFAIPLAPVAGAVPPGPGAAPPVPGAAPAAIPAISPTPAPPPIMPLSHTP